MITQEGLKELFDYRGDGQLTYRVSLGRVKVGDMAGYTNIKGYTVIGIRGKTHKAHRLIWLYHHGSWPTNQIDHINGIRNDNRIENLRNVTSQENQQNCKKSKKNTSGVTGVCWHKRDQKWRVQVRLNGKIVSLGYFTEKEEAIAVRNQWEVDNNYHPNHGRG